MRAQVNKQELYLIESLEREYERLCILKEFQRSMLDSPPQYYNGWAGSMLAGRIEALADELKKIDSLLDIGCFSGEIGLALLERGIVQRVFGIDRFSFNVAWPKKFTFLNQDILALKYDLLPKTDAVICLNTFHHLISQSWSLSRDLLKHLILSYDKCIIEIGSMSEIDENSTWLTEIKSRWKSDSDMWDELFVHAKRKRVLLEYEVRGGVRVMWCLER